MPRGLAIANRDEIMERFLVSPHNRTNPIVPNLRPPTTARPMAALSPREKEIASLVARGYSNKRIAAELYVSPETVKNHLHNVYVKLGLQGHGSRAALARWVLTK